MKKIALAMSVSVLALAAPAVAGDGFYMGLGLGYNANENSVVQDVSAGGWFLPVNNTAIDTAPADDISTDAYGAHIFFGYQAHIDDKVVLGLEVDAAGFDGETLDTATAPYNALGTFTVTQNFSQQWISTIRAKLGFDVTPDATLFVTGGFAVSDVELRTTFSDTYAVVAQRIGPQTGVTSELKSGYVYGGGLDWALGGSTKLRVEYLRVDLGHVDTSIALNFNGPPIAPTGNTLSSSADLQTNSVRVGLSWDLNL